MKTFDEFIREDWLTNLKNPGFGKEFKVYDNPTPKDLGEIDADSYGDVRFLVDAKTGKVYAFNALLIHDSVLKYLKLDPKSTYKGIGRVKRGKIYVGASREPYSVILNNPPFDYSSLYYEDPQLAFERLKQNCTYLHNPLFIPDSVDAMLRQELRAAYR